ncbi:MAG TPA: hydroxyacylglutathione hydrolase [Rhodocyclaceae bacterium]
MMNPLEIVGLPAFADNYIWVLRAPSGAVAVVDPGDETPVLDYLAATGDRLAAILVTHHHGDHCGGVEELVCAHPAPVFGPAAESIAGVDHPVGNGDRVNLPDLGIEFEVLGVPGHTRGHVAYYRRGMLFCGDTLFGAGCGRLFEGTAATMQASLARLRALPSDTQVYCAHEYTQSNLRFAAAVEPGNPEVRERAAQAARLRAANLPTVPAPLELELRTNPFLRWDAPSVVRAAQSRLGRAAHDDVEVFAAVRDWKDAF